MLLTLAVSRTDLFVSPDGEPVPDVFDYPSMIIREFELRGLNISASLLSGWNLDDLDRLRDRADKAGCPCLVLVEDGPLRFADRSAAKRAEARDRVKRLVVAANRLGCNALGIKCEGSASEADFETTAGELKEVMRAMDRMEVNLLIAPHGKMTEQPDRLTDLIKRVGGFRIGSLPSFAHAAASGDLVQTLRKLAPYAGAIHATIDDFDPKGGHPGYDLKECVQTIRSVGFVNTLAIDFQGRKNPVEAIEAARAVLQEAIDEDQV
ncbi:MAG: TIM barrel protein [Phycisphaerales bacterium]|nr:TIM barrel protein [Phycisphaerales bacterium]